MDIAYTHKCDERTALTLSGALDRPLEDVGVALATFERPDGGWEITVYATDENEAAVAKALLEHASDAHFERSELPDENWVVRSLEGLRPVRAGRFVVHGAHDRPAVRGCDIGIEIEAAEAFGTGHHATTAGCLLAIERSLHCRAPRTALDVGTGTGVLAIAIAKLSPASRIVASDIDPTSVRIARECARWNGVGPHIRFVRADGFSDATIRTGGPYDLIVANILAEPLRGMARPIAMHLAVRGSVILSGILDRQAASVLATFRRHGLIPQHVISQEGWTTLTLARAGRA